MIFDICELRETARIAADESHEAAIKHSLNKYSVLAEIPEYDWYDIPRLVILDDACALCRRYVELDCEGCPLLLDGIGDCCEDGHPWGFLNEAWHQCDVKMVQEKAREIRDILKGEEK